TTPSSATTPESSARSFRSCAVSEGPAPPGGLGRLPRAPGVSGAAEERPDDLTDDLSLAVVFLGGEVIAPPAADRLHQQQAPATFDVVLRLSLHRSARAAVADLHDQLPPVGGEPQPDAG